MFTSCQVLLGAETECGVKFSFSAPYLIYRFSFWTYFDETLWSVISHACLELMTFGDNCLCWTTLQHFCYQNLKKKYLAFGTIFGRF